MRIFGYRQLVRVCDNPVKLLKFLLDNGLIKRQAKCPRRNCRKMMVLIRDRAKRDGYKFRCSKCRTTQSIRKGSFFANSRLSIDDILCVTFCWACKLSVKSTAIMACVCPSSVCQWFQFIREKCSEALINDQDYTFGGPGVVVQIDESVVARRKYHVGRAVNQQWVFGLYDTSTKREHIQLVDDRRAETLIPIIQKYIKPGSTIFSDQWAAYRDLQRLGYVHHTVNHSQNFVDPTTGTFTNAIEAYWSRVKRNIRLHWLSRRDQLPLRIDEFLWWDRLNSQLYRDVFHEIIGLLAIN